MKVLGIVCACKNTTHGQVVVLKGEREDARSHCGTVSTDGATGRFLLTALGAGAVRSAERAARCAAARADVGRHWGHVDGVGGRGYGLCRHQRSHGQWLATRGRTGASMGAAE